MEPEIVTDPQPSTSKKNIVVIVLIIIVLIVASVLLHLAKKQATPVINPQGNIITENEISMDQEKFNEAKTLAASGNFDDAIRMFNELIDASQNKEDEGKLKIMMAGNLLYRSVGEDVSKAFDLYKSVATDPEMPLYVRSLALNNIANSIRSRGVSFYQLHFSDKPFNEFLPESGSDSYKLNRAFKEILELSLSLYPTSYAYYALAGNYYAPALATISSNSRIERLDGMNQEEAAKLMQEYIQKGDELEDDSLHVPHVNIQKYWYRSLAVNASGRALNHALDQRENGFQKAMSYGMQFELGSDQKSEYFMHLVRFYYAAFIATNFDESRNSEIIELLAPFGATAIHETHLGTSTREHFQALINSQDNSVIKQNYSKLAEISPEFQKFIESLK